MAPAPSSRSERTLVEVLAALSRGATRYEPEGELARGGMGAIHRVWDRDLRRPLAMKVFLGEVDDASAAPTDSRVDSRVARFVEEAQVTGQLDHPGIVPVHELALDDEGRLFFTMRLVEGHTLAEAFEKARSGADGWTGTRILRTLVRVCEAVAYAHSRCVVHRDLKPANIMVGHFGEVYVMDWGLAKVLGSEERAPTPGQAPSVRSDRAAEASTTADSHLLTMEGNVLGTPAYMPPEQARGQLQDVGPRSDVYALGALLYEFLTGRMPYVREGEATSAVDVLRAVLAGPPTPVAELAPDAPPELVAVCERAMARDPEERFAGALELAEALSASFERQVDQARTGLQRSRLVTVLQWVLGFSFVGLALALVFVAVLLFAAAADSSFALSLPLAFEVEEPSYELTSTRPWLGAIEIRETRGNLVLESSHWAAKLGVLGMVAVVILFLMYLVHQGRRILRNVRRGEPFALDNVRRMRRIGAALLVFGVLRMVRGPLMGAFVEQYVDTAGLVVRDSLEVSTLELLGAAAVFVLAEVFRVGAELERQNR